MFLSTSNSTTSAVKSHLVFCFDYFKGAAFHSVGQILNLHILCLETELLGVWPTENTTGWPDSEPKIYNTIHTIVVGLRKQKAFPTAL